MGERFMAEDVDGHGSTGCTRRCSRVKGFQSGSIFCTRGKWCREAAYVKT